MNQTLRLSPAILHLLSFDPKMAYGDILLLPQHWCNLGVIYQESKQTHFVCFVPVCCEIKLVTLSSPPQTSIDAHARIPQHLSLLHRSDTIRFTSLMESPVILKWRDCFCHTLFSWPQCKVNSTIVYTYVSMVALLPCLRAAMKGKCACVSRVTLSAQVYATKNKSPPPSDPECCYFSANSLYRQVVISTGLECVSSRF